MKEEDQMLQLVLNHFPVRVFWKDRNSTFLGCNHLHANDRGLKSAEEIVGKNDYDFFPKEEAELYIADDQKVIESNKAKLNFEEHQTRHDGSSRWLRTSKVPLLNSAGTVIGILGTYEDITERKKIEEALIESEAKYRELVEASSDCIWETDTDGKYLYMSPQIEAILGYKPDEVLGRSPLELMEPQEAERITKIFQDFHESGRPIISLQNINLHKSGRHVILETSIVPARNSAGEITGYRGISRDITERKELEEQLRQSEKLQAIGQLAGGIAHDFNNQLAGIVGYAEMLQEVLKDNDTYVNYTDHILLASKRAADLISQLLAFARKGKYLLKDIDLHDIIKETINILEHTIDKRIIISQHLNAYKPVIKGDPSQIQNAIMNLAINARDAMSSGGELLFSTEIVTLNKAYCRTSSYDIKPGKFVKLIVSDSGCGMDKNTQEKIFEPFFTTKEKGKGTGMGLAAVYGTVRNHGGAISIYSKIDKGTKIEIYLPQHIRKIVEQEIHVSKIEKEIKTGRILLVDDEQMIINTCSLMLKNLGYTVTSCNDGKQAVSYYRDNWKDIDLVILDIIMPEMDGKMAYTKMKEINPNIIAVLSSGYSIEGEAQQITDKGIRGYIHKPFRKYELSKIISNILKD